MATVGTAYVQIVPSAKGIGASISGEVNPAAAAAGDSAGDALGNNLVNKVKTILAAAGIGKAISASINAGADLQQSLGGIETLYRESFDTVAANAQRAFQTAGVSANDYMQMAIQSGASMLSSVDGDTAEAARLMDTAIIDMSDNVNKMGTTMESVQNAYRGFSRGNFSMLDNLALGFSGTKEGMQQLLAQAEAISGVKYDISSYSDIVSAIHVVQEELGITGTTAREAAETISGSQGMMKASWQNLLADLALGKDVGDDMKALGDSAATYLQNLIPAVQSVVTQIPTVLGTMMPAIMDMLPEMIDAAGQLIGGLIQGFANNAPMIISSITGTILTLINALSSGETVTYLANAAIKIIEALAMGFVSAAPKLANAAENLIMSLGSALMQELPNIIQIGSTLLVDIMDGFVSGLPDAIGKLGIIIQTLINEFLKMAPKLASIGMDLIQGLMTGLVEAAPQILSAAGDVIARLIEGFMQNAPQIAMQGMEMVNQLLQGLLNNMPAVMEAVANLIFQIITVIVENLPQFLEAGIQLIGMIAEGIVTGVGAVLSAIGELVESIWNAFKDIDWAGIGRNIIDGIANGIKNAASKLWETVKSVAQTVFDSFNVEMDIRSPSKLMAWSGKMIDLGLAHGIKDNLSVIDDAVGSMSDKTVSASIGIASASGMGVSSGMATVSPDSLGQVAAAIVNGLSSLMDNGGGDQTAAIYLGENEVGKAILPAIRRWSKVSPEVSYG